MLTLFAFLLCLALSAAFSGMETGIYSLEGVRIQLRARDGDRVGRQLLLLASDPAFAVCTILIVNNLVNYLVALFSGQLLGRWITAPLGPIQMELLNTLCVVPLLFIFGELVPKDLFLRFPMRLVPLVHPLYRLASWGLRWPVVLVLALIRRLAGEDGNEGALISVRREVLSGMLTGKDSAVPMTDAQRELASRLMALREVPVRERMVPASRIVAVDTTDGREGILEVGQTHALSRLLVRDPETRGFLGYLNVLDVLFDEGDLDFGRLVHSLPTASPDESVTRVLTRLQRARRPLALVLEDGEVVGLIGSNDISGEFLSLGG